MAKRIISSIYSDEREIENDRYYQVLSLFGIIGGEKAS